MPLSLTNTQIRFFFDTGYLMLPDIIAPDLVETVRQQAQVAVADVVEPIRVNENGAVTHLDQVIHRHPCFRELATAPKLIEALIQLLGPNIQLTLNRHNHATFNRAGHNPVRLHRDVLQWSRPVITAAIYIDDATSENGCTRLVPSSHFLPYVGTPNNGGTWMDEHHEFGDLLQQAVEIPCVSGSVLLFNSLTFHTVGENTTPSTRLSVTFAYHSVDELASVADDNKMLVAGSCLYRGNDRTNSPANNCVNRSRESGGI